MLERTGPGAIWPAPEFFLARCREQRERHRRFDDTASNLEPNLKDGPGALRDIHTVEWVAKRHFGAGSLGDLVEPGFLTPSEHRSLTESREYLWEIRLRLHLLTAPRRGPTALRPPEATCCALRLSRRRPEPGGREVHEDATTGASWKFPGRTRCCSHCSARRFSKRPQRSARFRSTRASVAVDGYLEVTDPGVFVRRPIALLELFLLLQQRSDLEGVRASTIRLVRSHRHLIDEPFRSDPEARGIFREILRQPRHVAREVRRMHRYGLLARYLPEFEAVAGQMQYDLFHAYTVDEHSLFALGGVRAFAAPEKRNEFPLCSAVFETLRSSEVLYIAALFHDIGKGRGGDHSELGARSALAFCRRHGLDRYDSRLVGLAGSPPPADVAYRPEA